MSAKKSFLKFLEVLVNEDERTRVFKEYLEYKTDCIVAVEKVGIPGISDSFEFQNIKITSPDRKVRINSEVIKLISTQLSSLIAAGKILLNSMSEVPVEIVEGHGIFISLGPEDKPSLELFSKRALFKGIECKIKYDSTTKEPEFTGTLSATDIDSDISMSYSGIEMPKVSGSVDLTFNLKTLTGTADIRISGKKENNNGEEKKIVKEKKKEKVSFDDLSLNMNLEFTLFPYTL